jgi:hypothetical protein
LGDKRFVVGYSTGTTVGPVYLPLHPFYFKSPMELVIDSISCLDLDGNIEWNKENPYKKEIGYNISPDSKWIAVYYSNAHEMASEYRVVSTTREQHPLTPCSFWVELLDTDGNTRFSGQFKAHVFYDYFVGWKGTAYFYCVTQNAGFLGCDHS